MTTVDVRAALDSQEIEQGYELDARIFGPSYFERLELLRSLRLLEPDEEPGHFVVALAGRRVVGFTRVTRRRLRLKNTALWFGGITQVCVHPEHRNQNIGSRLIECATGICRQRADVGCLLFARRAVDGWYSRLGFVGLGCHPETRLLGAPGGGDVELKPGCDAAVLSKFANDYAETYREIPYSFERGADFWQHFQMLLAARNLDRSFYPVIRNGNHLGYAIIANGAVIELAASRKLLPECVEALLAARLPNRTEQPVFRLPQLHPAMECLRKYEHAQSVRFSWNGGHMAKMLDARGVEKPAGWHPRSGSPSPDALVSALADFLRPFLPPKQRDVPGPDMAALANVFGHLPTWNVIDEF